MADNDTLAQVSAAVTGPNSPNAVSVERPSTKAEWTFIGAGAAAVVLSIFVISVLTWWAPFDHQKVEFIGIMGIIAVVGVPLMIAALCSPTIGHISAKAGPSGVDVDLQGGAK